MYTGHYFILLYETKNRRPEYRDSHTSAQSYRYNLNKGVVTVYYLSKPPTEIAFHLSPKEKEQIIEQYYALELNKLEDNTSVQEECMDMPKLYTTIHMKSATRTQKIRIDEDCTSFSAKEARKARRVKQFLRVVHRILGTKPEIKTPPMSDIFYI